MRGEDDRQRPPSLPRLGIVGEIKQRVLAAAVRWDPSPWAIWCKRQKEHQGSG